MRARNLKNASLVLLAALLAACSHTPPEIVAAPEGKNRVSVNSPTVISEAMGSYYRKLRLAKAKVESKKVTVKISVKQALDQYVPKDIRVYADDSLDLNAAIDYEKAKPWAEALGDSLSEVDVEMTADLGKRLMTLKPALLSVSKIIEKYAPSDFTVYAEDDVDLSGQAYFDRTLGWPEALGKSLSTVNIASTINLSRKLIVLKTKRTAASVAIPPQVIPKAE